MILTLSNRAARFGGWELWFFEHHDKLHAITQEAIDEAFDKAMSEIHGGVRNERN